MPSSPFLLGGPGSSTGPFEGAKPTRRSSTPPTTELGKVTAFAALPGWANFTEELEYVPELTWPESTFMYHRMRSDTQLAALMRASTWPIRRYRWMIDPNGATQERARLLAQDLNLPLKGEERKARPRRKNRFAFNDHMRQAFLALWYGHYPFEQIGRMVDGRWTLRKLGPRPPHTLSNIIVADDGGLVAIEQDIQGSKNVPVDRLMMYVWEMEGANWSGRSFVRECYQPWLLKDRELRVDAIRHERNGMGVPIVETEGKPTPAQMEAASQLAQSYKIGESSGGAMPPGMKLRLIGVEGAVSDVLSSIRYHDEAMARFFLAMFVQLGQTRTGSRALGESFTNFFDLAQEVIADWFADTFNEHMIEDYWDWNYGEDEEDVPLLVYEKDKDPDLAIADFNQMVVDGLITVDEELEDWVRDRYLLPERKGPRPAPAPAGQGLPGSGVQEPSPTPVPGQAPTKKEKPVAKDGKKVAARAAETPSKIKLVTRPRIPILSVGEFDLLLNKGPEGTVFSEDDLRSAVAAQNDPAVRFPRLGTGHESQFGDGEPAFGRWENLFFNEDDSTLYGDLTGLPESLDEILDTAYPNRSIEGRWNITSSTGTEHRFVVDAVKLLGVKMPGVSSLADLPDLYNGNKKPELTGVPDKMSDETVAVYAAGKPVIKVMAAQLSVEMVRRAFQSEQGDDWRRWIREIYIDPKEVIVEDNKAEKLYRQPFTVDDSGEIEFGEAVEVVFKYEDAKVAARAVATYASAQDSRIPNQEKHTMEKKELAKALGLPEDATDEQIKARREELAKLLVDDPAETAEEKAAREKLEADALAKAEADKKKAAIPAEGTKVKIGDQEITLPPGVVLMDEAAVAELKSGATDGKAAREEQLVAARGAEVDAAVSAGKIPPSRKEYWLGYLQRDPEGGKQVLASMPAGSIPVEAAGSGSGGTEGVGASGAATYEPGWLSQSERGRIEAVKGNTWTDPIVMGEGGTPVSFPTVKAG